MNRPCAYKDSLGSPGVGFHEARLGPFALWDVVGTLVIIIILILMGVSVVTAIAGVVITTIFAHWLFCVSTAGNVMLGL
jgi:membrane protein DedA with SNARE-associated domain